MVSTAIHCALGFPAIQGLALLGGALWAIANAFAIPIMNRLGMALAMLVWNTLSCLTGWATSRYGLFGLQASVPASLFLNYLGILVLITGGVMYMFVKSNTQESSNAEEDMNEEKGFYAVDAQRKKDAGLQEISLLMRIGSLIAAMLSGTFYGSMWNPVNYIKTHPENFPGAPQESLPYLFSFFLGVLCTSVAVFALYSFVKRNTPLVSAESALPSMLAGAIFAVAMASFVVAIDQLNASIAYPICAMAPGLVVTSWSVLYFREITGRRNLVLLSIAYGFTLVGVALMTISKEVAFP